MRDAATGRGPLQGCVGRKIVDLARLRCPDAPMPRYLRVSFIESGDRRLWDCYFWIYGLDILGCPQRNLRLSPPQEVTIKLQVSKTLWVTPYLPASSHNGRINKMIGRKHVGWSNCKYYDTLYLDRIREDQSV